MFFERMDNRKKVLIALCWSLASMILLSCGLEIGEKPIPDAAISVGDTGFSCMGDVAKTTKRYIDGSLSDKDVDEFGNCLKYSLQSFVKYTDVQNENGKKLGRYSSGQLRAYVQKHFLKGRTLSADLMNEIMAVKQLVVGGSTESLTKTEINKLIEVIDVLEKEAIRLQPYIPIYNTTVGKRLMERGVTMPNLDEAISALHTSAARIGSYLEAGERPYAYKNLEGLIHSFRDFVDWGAHFKSVEPPTTWVELVKTFESLVIGPGHIDLERKAGIEGDKWKEILVSASNWYALLLKYTYQVEPYPKTQGPGLENFIRLVHSGVDLTREAVDAQGTGVIDYDRLGRLADIADELEMLPYGLSADSIKSVLHPVFDQILGDTQARPEARRVPGLDRSVLARAEQEFVQWAHIQRYLDRASRHGSGQGIENWETTQSFGWDQFFEVFGCATCSTSELERIITNMRPLFPEGEEHIFLIEESELKENKVVHGFHNLSMMNVIRGSVRLLFRGYSENPQRFEKLAGITEKEMQDFYLDFKKIGVELRIMDPRNNQAGARAFMEGNIFTYLADGLNQRDASDPMAHLLRFEESSEYLAFAYSGGNLGNFLYDTLRKQCGSDRDPVDALGLPKVRRTCIQENFLPYLTQSIPNMPKMKAFIEGLSEEEWGTFQRQLMDAVKRPEEDSKWVEHMEITAFAMVLHYVEAVMTKSYNANGDGVLTNEEVWAAYPVYRGLIQKMAQETLCMELNENMTRDVYAYILKYGEIPEPSIFDGSTWDRLLHDLEWGNMFARIRRGEDWDFVTARLNSNKKMILGKWLGWDFQLDRMKLARVFSAIVKNSLNEDDAATCTVQEIKAPVKEVPSKSEGSKYLEKDALKDHFLGI